MKNEKDLEVMAIEYAVAILKPYIPNISPQMLIDLNTQQDLRPIFEQRYKVKEVASILHCSVKHVWNLIERGKLTPERGAGITRIKESDIAGLLK